MRAGIISAILITILGIAVFTLNRYQSAFEADQACHYDISEKYGNREAYGCDHDMETNQWLLYERSEVNNSPAKVIKRYKY